jgi:hypothetical protein
MEPQDIVLSAISQVQKGKYCLASTSPISLKGPHLQCSQSTPPGRNNLRLLSRFLEVSDSRMEL